MIVDHEYLAVDVLRGRWPDGVPDDDQLGLPATHHYRLLQRVRQPGSGRISRIRAGLSDAGREAIRRPHPDIVEVLDSRPLLDPATQIAARYGTGGLLFTETLAAGLAHRRALYFGTDDNVGDRFAGLSRFGGSLESVGDRGGEHPVPVGGRVDIAGATRKLD